MPSVESPWVRGTAHALIWVLVTVAVRSWVFDAHLGTSLVIGLVAGVAFAAAYERQV